MPDSVNYRGFPKGINNRRANHDVPQGMLRDGVNVDVLASGRVRRRRGIAQAVADAGAHSIFSDGTRMVYATTTALKLVTPNLAVTTLLTDAKLAKPISYVALHGEIYFSNEDINGKINAANAYEAWGVTPPAAPTLAATAGDRFVQVTCTFVMASGEESGAPRGAVVACGDAPIIGVSNIPQSADSRVVSTRLYVTALNGTEFYAEVDVPAGVTSTTLTGKFGTGQKLMTQFMSPPPPGQLLEYLNGRIYIAAGANVFHTQPLRYALYDPSEDYLMYPKRVTLLKAAADGMYLSADRTYFEAGIGTPDVRHVDLFPYKAIEGAACNLPESKDVMWLSERGFIRGSAGGAIKNLTESQVAIDSFTRACLGIIERDGHKAVVAIAKSGKASSLVAIDYVAAEVTRLAELE